MGWGLGSAGMLIWVGLSLMEVFHHSVVQIGLPCKVARIFPTHKPLASFCVNSPMARASHVAKSQSVWEETIQGHQGSAVAAQVSPLPCLGLSLVYGAECFSLRERAEAPDGLLHRLALLPVSCVTLARQLSCAVPQCSRL